VRPRRRGASLTGVGAGTTTVLRPQPITAESWERFGWLPVDDTDPRDGENTLEFAWTDPHLNVISHGPAEVERTGEGTVVDRMYRHDSHTQALMALNCRGIVAVAPASATLSDESGLSLVRAFVVEPLAALVLRRGTWHWGPHPLGDDPIRLLNVQGRRYIDDNASADIAALARVVVANP
jgi:ureidoglycolate hydrolase